jgi:ubiquinone/menaquinone biosynthesis C-methylase UbiE
VTRGIGHSHGHSHGQVDHSIVRSRAAIRAVTLSLGLLAATAAAQAAIFVVSDSVALLADLIHNVGDALTAVPLGIAFALRNARAERISGLFVVLAIFVSACVALYQSVARLIDPVDLSHLWVLAAAGIVGFAGNEAAAWVRLRAGRRLDSPALVADGYHARTDGLVSLGVVLSAIVVALGFERADPLIGLAITAVIMRITWQSWQTVRVAPAPTTSGKVIRRAALYDLRFRARSRGNERAFRAEQLDLAGLEPGNAVLDVGCGTGTLALAAKERVGSTGVVYGIDPSPEMIARARRKARKAGADVAFEVAVAEALPFPASTFDVVLISLTMHQLPPVTQHECIEEVSRVLRPDGRLLVVDIGGPQDATRTPHARHGHVAWDLDTVVAPLLSRAGLRELESGAIAFKLERFERLRYVLAGRTPGT